MVLALTWRASMPAVLIAGAVTLLTLVASTEPANVAVK